MTVPVVGMLRIVYLEVKRVLQVIAWLLASQARHDHCPAGDLDHPKLAGLGKARTALRICAVLGIRCALRHRSSWLSGQMSQSSLMP